MPKYPWLLFDADDTLFDFTTTETRAFEGAFREAGLEYQPEWFPLYQKYNRQVWQELEQKLITPVELRTRRFRLFFAELEMGLDAEQFSARFLRHLSYGTTLLPQAEETLIALAPRHHICLVTNGLAEVQRPRLEHSSIIPLVEKVFISEEMGAAKPEKAFFDLVFAGIGNPPKKDALIIGDSLTSDIRGGIEYGLDSCWYNPRGQETELPVTYQIRTLPELIALVDD